ncbi:MAG: hypothetical protein JJ978_06160 [Roseivirga sp.]|jgi:hypothetical protein|uniref:hypothetical protein n=1 Tax=Roseivirga sp. TaxID=1964215 RepID=UPI001B0152FF|nr:hypothetical protein [Roseivirga sp.]MBO6495128.1 hypothetical protein [Roseivirga sp.]
MEYPDFKTWLKQKKIDPKAFASKEMERFMELKKLFDQVNPNSFTAQKLFLINSIRRAYPLQEEEAVAVKKKPMAKPRIVKPKTN